MTLTTIAVTQWLSHFFSTERSDRQLRTTKREEVLQALYEHHLGVIALFERFTKGRMNELDLTALSRAQMLCRLYYKHLSHDLEKLTEAGIEVNHAIVTRAKSRSLYRDVTPEEEDHRPSLDATFEQHLCLFTQCVDRVADLD